MISQPHRPPPKYPLLPLLLCLGLFCAVYFLPVDAPAYAVDWETAFSDLGRALEDPASIAEVFAPQPSAAVLTPPTFAQTSAQNQPASDPTSTQNLPTFDPTSTQNPPAFDPTSTQNLPTFGPTSTQNLPVSDPTSTQSPPPSSTPSPTPTSRPYSGPDLPAGATMEYDPLEFDADAETKAEEEGVENPVEGSYTSSFGWRTHPITGASNFHRGVDITAAEGTPVAAFASGEVVRAGWDDSYGNYIQIKHSETCSTLYAHCSQLLCAVGDEVEKGQTIAKSGATGQVTGPHLHFEIKVNGLWHDPTYYLTLS